MSYKADGDHFSIIEVPAGYKLVACNHCGFTFDACHSTGNSVPAVYDCPLCELEDRHKEA